MSCDETAVERTCPDEGCRVCVVCWDEIYAAGAAAERERAARVAEEFLSMEGEEQIGKRLATVLRQADCAEAEVGKTRE